MKIIFISIISIALSLDLYARENPFEPTETFIQIQKQYINAHENQEQEHEKIEYEEDKEKQELLIKQPIKQIKLKKKEKSITYNILSFVNATTTSNTLTINVDNKYKLKNQDILHKNKKFVFDFIGSVNIYTKKVNLEHPYFESITIGSHIEKNFFRIVIKLKENIKNYAEHIDKSIITITKQSN